MYKRILLIGSYLPSILNFRGDLIESLIHDGFEVFVSAPDAKLYPEELEKIKKIGAVFFEIPISRTGLNPLKDLKTLFAIRKLILVNNITHLLAYTIKPVIYGLLATAFTKLKHKTALITGLGYAFGNGDGVKFRIVSFIAHLLYKTALRFASRVIFQNPDDCKLFESKGLVPSYKTAVVNGSGINTEKFPFVPITPKKSICFLFIARLIHEKGIYDFVEAAKQLREKWKSAEFHVVGWIDDNPTAIKKIELDSWIEQGIITFHGKLKDVRHVLVQSDVFVLPSFYPEGTPRTILEALSIGRAVITTDMPGCKETVADGFNGFIINPNKVLDLKNAMEVFLDKPELISEMSVNSRNVALEKYCVRKVNKNMLELING